MLYISILLNLTLILFMFCLQLVSELEKAKEEKDEFERKLLIGIYHFTTVLDFDLEYVCSVWRIPSVH